MKHALAFAFIFTAVCAIVAASKNQDDDDDGSGDDSSGIYDGAMKWVASIGPFSDGEGRPHLSSDLIYDSTRDCRERTSKAIGKAKDTCHTACEEAGQVKDKVCETAREAAHLTREAMSKAKDKASYNKDVIANTLSAGHKVAKKEGKETVKAAKEAVKIARTLGHDISGNVTQAIEGGGLGSVVNLFATASALGEGLWVTFIWGPSLRTNLLPRQQLETVETKMYKLYLKSMSSSIGMALLGHCLSQRNADTLQSFNLLASLMMLLLNLALVTPLSNRMMRQRIKLEKEGRRGSGEESGDHEPQPPIIEDPAASEEAQRAMGGLNHRIKRLQLYSSLLNAMTLSALTWHLYYLSHRLSTTT